MNKQIQLHAHAALSAAEPDQVVGTWLLLCETEVNGASAYGERATKLLTEKEGRTDVA
jgi:hypothetical protein